MTPGLQVVLISLSLLAGLLALFTAFVNYNTARFNASQAHLTEPKEQKEEKPHEPPTAS